MQQQIRTFLLMQTYIKVSKLKINKNFKEIAIAVDKL